MRTPISEEDAKEEGGYTPIEFEKLFRELYPNWEGDRWAFKFHAIAVLKDSMHRRPPTGTSEIDV